MAKAMLAAVFGAVLSTSVFAHHPFVDEFDRNQPVALSGTVTKLEWQNPHVYAYIDVKNEQGQITNWKIEMGSPGELTRAGWN